MAKRRTRKRSKKKKKIEFSKVLLISILVLCLEIIVYAEVIMAVTRDLSALYALIGIVAALAGAIWAYCSKSKAENTSGGIVYDTAMRGASEGGGLEVLDLDDVEG